MKTLTKSEETPVAERARPMTYLTPPANIFETKDGYVLECEMPGVRKEGLELLAEGTELTLTGRRTDRWEQEFKGEVLFRESRSLDYRRTFELDPSIDTSKIVATMDQGLLRLTLPKTEQVKPRKIKVTD